MIVKIIIIIINNNDNNNCVGNRDKTIDDKIISECSIIAQKKYKSKRDRVGKVVDWESYNTVKFGHADKKYTHNPEPVLENEKHKILWGLEIQMDHHITARRQDCVFIGKKKPLGS